MHRLKATVWIGKHGCTRQTLDEIAVQLEKRGVVKIRWLRNTSVDPDRIARECRARLLSVRGRTMILEKPGRADR
ncbi:MAG: YhbY family RNA-binding protein [Methanomicrobiales archaeon]|nr:YhbY family RNA-binding protein [Methanomicrobiales archaeon]